MWIDPIVASHNTQQIQVQGCTEFVMMLADIAPACKSTCGLSNISNGAPDHLRGILNRTYAIFLNATACIRLSRTPSTRSCKRSPKGKRPELEALVHKVMDGEPVETAGLSKEETDYVKTARVLIGQTLYSDSWLDL